MVKLFCLQVVTLGLMLSGLTGCVSMQDSTPIPATESLRISVSEALPASLPSDAKLIPDTHFAVVYAENPATLLVPVPFVGDAVESAVNSERSRDYRDNYVGIDLVQFTRDAMSLSSLYSASSSDMQVHPIAYIQECVDDVFRISLALHLESSDWSGRYLYHVPSPIPSKDIKSPTFKELENMKMELRQGFSKLVELVERDVAGKLKSNGDFVDFGSLYLYGSRLGGLVSPYMMHLSDGELIEEGQDYVIFRHSGDMGSAGTTGALLFGVHYFRKDQLHTFQILPAQ